MFNLIRKFQNIFQSGCIILHSQQQYMSIPVALLPHQHLLLLVFFISATVHTAEANWTRKIPGAKQTYHYIFEIKTGWKWGTKTPVFGNSLAVQWLGLCTFTAEVPGSTPGWGTNIPQAVQRGKKKKKKRQFHVFLSIRETDRPIFIWGSCQHKAVCRNRVLYEYWCRVVNGHQTDLCWCQWTRAPSEYGPQRYWVKASYSLQDQKMEVFSWFMVSERHDSMVAIMRDVKEAALEARKPTDQEIGAQILLSRCQLWDPNK